jgi:LPXTG-motif cell wall-anchored protein
VPGTLPFTGGETDTTALVALVALLAGAGLVALTREEADS